MIDSHAAAVPAHGVPGAAVPAGRSGGPRVRLNVALAEAHVAEAAAGGTRGEGRRTYCKLHMAPVGTRTHTYGRYEALAPAMGSMARRRGAPHTELHVHAARTLPAHASTNWCRYRSRPSKLMKSRHSVFQTRARRRGNSILVHFGALRDLSCASTRHDHECMYMSWLAGLLVAGHG
jgi:hypothetical protein